MCLTVHFRRGQPQVAYLGVARKLGEKVTDSRELAEDIIVDFNGAGELLGMEFSSPELATLPAVNGILRDHGIPPLDAFHLKPLLEYKGR